MSAGRRGNGEGTILKRAEGRWAAAIVVDYRRKWIYGKTRREVVDRLRKIQGDIAGGRPVINERLTMAEYLNRWLDEVAKMADAADDAARLRATRSSPHPAVARKGAAGQAHAAARSFARQSEGP